MTFVLVDEDEAAEKGAIIKVVGVGGGGSNAVDRMIHAGLRGVEFVAINTDAQALRNSAATQKVQIGTTITKGLGSGADPVVGREAAREDRGAIVEVLAGADMVFITAGLGGGTGTGAAPIVADVAREIRALTVAIVTKPFLFEGKTRTDNSRNGLEDLEKWVDTMIVVPNQRLLEVVGPETSMADAFRRADDALYWGVQSISDLITIPGVINLDFADVKTIMRQQGRGLMGVGMAKGKDRAVRAARQAINCPLLEQSNIRGASGIILNISGGKDMTMFEVNAAADVVRKSAAEDANIIFGAVIGRTEQEEIKVTVIATGFADKTEPCSQRPFAEPVFVPLDLFPDEMYDQPAFMRKARQGTDLRPRLETRASADSTQLDFPTFLRRRRGHDRSGHTPETSHREGSV